MEFMGYKRPDGSVGIRNHLLILPVHRIVSSLSFEIHKLVPGTKTYISTGEVGRSSKDRETIARTLLGLALNGNVGGVLVIGDKHSHYKELDHEEIAEKVRNTGKPVEILDLTLSGGFYEALAHGFRKARKLALEVSRVRREPCQLKDLVLGVKCGMSDSSSGIAGNPVVGKVFDMLVNTGGTAIFSETTEVIGAEDILAKRCINEEVKRDLLDAVFKVEEKAKATGEDIRKINPIPENIKGGLTTLEEKSLGAIAKSGSMPIMGVLKYGERPSKKGLYFMDAWMSSLSLPLGNAAAGATLFFYQMGGQGLPEVQPPMPAYSSGIITPLMYLTGNNKTYEKIPDGIDFCSGDVMMGTSSIEDMAEALLERVIDIASGTKTKAETYNYMDPVEIYYKDHSF